MLDSNEVGHDVREKGKSALWRISLIFCTYLLIVARIATSLYISTPLLPWIAAYLVVVCLLIQGSSVRARTSLLVSVLQMLFGSYAVLSFSVKPFDVAMVSVLLGVLLVYGVNKLKRQRSDPALGEELLEPLILFFFVGAFVGTLGNL